MNGVRGAARMLSVRLPAGTGSFVSRTRATVDRQHDKPPVRSRSSSAGDVQRPSGRCPGRSGHTLRLMAIIEGETWMSGWISSSSSVGRRSSTARTGAEEDDSCSRRAGHRIRRETRHHFRSDASSTLRRRHIALLIAPSISSRRRGEQPPTQVMRLVARQSAELSADSAPRRGRAAVSDLRQPRTRSARVPHRPATICRSARRQ